MSDTIVKISESNDLIIKIKLSNDSKEHEIKISGNIVDPTVNDLLIKIKELLNLTNSNKNIRMIFSGKLLQPTTALLRDFNIKSGSYVHVVINEITNTTLSSIPPQSTNLSISPISNVSRSTLQGLDILLSSETDNSFPNPIFRVGYNLTVNEIAALRSSFRNTIDEFHEQNLSRLPQLPNEDDHAYRLRIETNWLYTLTSDSEFVLNLPRNRLIDSQLDRQLDSPINIQIGISDVSEQAQGSYNDFIWGFFMGYFLGYIMMFCIWDRNVTQRQKLGIISGVMFQLLTDIIQTKPTEKKK